MSTTAVNGLNVLAIYVTDLARSKAFYEAHLGFKECEKMEPGIIMKAGSVTIYLEASRVAKRSEKNTAEFSPCFATESVKDSFETLKAAGVTIHAEYQEYGQTFALFKVLDPDGNLIEFAGTP